MVAFFLGFQRKVSFVLVMATGEHGLILNLRPISHFICLVKIVMYSDLCAGQCKDSITRPLAHQPAVRDYPLTRPARVFLLDFQQVVFQHNTTQQSIEGRD